MEDSYGVNGTHSLNGQRPVSGSKSCNRFRQFTEYVAQTLAHNRGDC